MGVVIDMCLTWEKHVGQIVKRCYAVLVGLARMRHRLPRATKRLLVEVSYAACSLVVTASACEVAAQRSIKCVQKVIDFGARIVTGLGQR